MDSIDPAISTSTVGELECGCWFDQPGTHEIGAWIDCPQHRAPARLVASSVAAPAGGLIAA
jgi:hypothetical protein